MLSVQSISANFFNQLREGLGHNLSMRQKKIAQPVDYLVYWWTGAESTKAEDEDYLS
jgi:hypothetical protein